MLGHSHDLSNGDGHTTKTQRAIILWWSNLPDVEVRKGWVDC